MDSIIWTEATEPQNTTLADVIYNIRREDPENLLMDSVMPGDILADADEVLMLDALVVPYQQLTRRMTIMRRLMNRAGTKLKVQEDTDEMTGMVISEPFKKNGAAQIAVTFNLDDGQTISVFFHNPDATPAKIAPGDDLISWKWLLNKKDVTIVVAPEHGKDLDVHEVARRVMKLADKNMAAFARANAKKAERLKTIAAQGTEIETLEKQLAEAEKAFNEMKDDAEKQAKRRADADAKFLAAEKRVADLTEERDELKAKREAEAAAKKAAEEKAAAEAAKRETATPEKLVIHSDEELVAAWKEYRARMDGGKYATPSAKREAHRRVVDAGEDYLSSTYPTMLFTYGDNHEIYQYDGGDWKWWGEDEDHRGYTEDSRLSGEVVEKFVRIKAGLDKGVVEKIGAIAESGPTRAQFRSAVEANGSRDFSDMTESEFLDLAKKFGEGDDSDAEAVRIAEAIDNKDQNVIDALVGVMKKYGYDAFSWGKSIYDEQAAGFAYRLNGTGWEKVSWAGRNATQIEKEPNFAMVLQDLGQALETGAVKKGMGGLDDPRLSPDLTPVDEWAAIEAELNQIIEGTHKRLDDPGLANWLTSLDEKYASDEEKAEKIEAASEAWANYAIAEAGKVLKQ